MSDARKGRPSGRRSGARKGHGTADFRTRGRVSPPRREPARPQKRPGSAPPVSEEASQAFRVIIAVHRPRYRNRAVRALAINDWQVRVLVNKEDPIGLINQQPPHLLVISDDFGRQKALGIVRAAQRFRGSPMQIIGLFEEADEMLEAESLIDAGLAPPWKAIDLRALAAGIYEELMGKPPEMPSAPMETEDE